MSSFMFHEGVCYSFNDFCLLSEALLPKETPYGMYPECSDKKIDIVHGNITTWFKEGSDVFLVQIDSNGELGFARHVSGRPFVFEQGNYVMDTTLPMTNSISVFGKVFFIALLLSEKASVKKLKFSGTHPQLGTLYSRLLSNKSILKVLHDRNWSESFEKIPNVFPPVYQHVLTRK